MDVLERLATLFKKFPGIGPRQAERFVQFLLRSSPAIRRELIDGVRELGTSVHQCPECFRFFSGKRDSCSICRDAERDHNILVVVASDADLAALEHSRNYHGQYFVLGGTIDLASDKMDQLRIKQLLASIQARMKKGLKEIILAFPANPEGDATSVRLKEELAALGNECSIAVTSLGRGLSTGSELEYADSDTIKNALASRK